MDCCICSPMASIYRPPRNTICANCYEGARRMIAFLKEIDGEEGEEANTSTNGLRLNPSKGISDAFKRMKEIKATEERMKERLSFMDDLVSALNDGVHTDVLIQPGSGPPIPAHRALLATRSEIFKTVLSSDECKEAPAGDTISLPELSHEEVQCLLEFLYCGTLRPNERAQTHACSLLTAADKYNVPFLKKFCEDLILQSLSPCNSLQVLEVADACSNTRLKEQAMETVVKHMEDVVLSAAYDSFALKNGHLSVEITRALLVEMKKAKKRTEQGMEVRGAMNTNNALSQPEMIQISDFGYRFPST